MFITLQCCDDSGIANGQTMIIRLKDIRTVTKGGVWQPSNAPRPLNLSQTSMWYPPSIFIPNNTYIKITTYNGEVIDAVYDFDAFAEKLAPIFETE